MRRSMLFVLVLVAVGLFASEIPKLMNYQGKLTNVDGIGINGIHNMTFSIYGDSIAGAALWSEEHTGVQIEHGLFSVIIGSTIPMNLPFDKQYYLQISIGDTIIVPRMQFTSSPYAIRASVADALSDSFGFYQNGENIYFNNSGNIGIGTDSPTVKLDVVGDAKIDGLLEVTVGIDPPFVAFIPQSSRPVAEPSHPHRIWVDDSTPGILYYYNGVEDIPLPGTGGGSVDTFVAQWDSIRGIPADIADGDDDTQLSETEVENYITNEAIDLADGSTVGGTTINDWNDLTNIPADIADGDDFEANTIDTFVAHWDSVRGIPADIADGDDDTQISETEVEIYITNGAIDLADGSTVGGTTINDWNELINIPADIADGDKIDTMVAHWDSIRGIPADIADGDDDTQLSEAEVEIYITNGAIDLADGSTVGGTIINDWNELINIPADIADGDKIDTMVAHWDSIRGIPADIADGDDDTQLTEAQVETYITNGAIDLADGSTVGGTTINDWNDLTNIPADIADGDKIDTMVAHWDSIRSIPADIADGDDDTQLSETEVETYITNGAIDLADGSTVGGTTINDWNDLTNIPADIADGDKIDTMVAHWDSIRGIPADIADGDDIGFTQLRANGSPWLTDSVTLAEGTNVTLTQTGDSITIDATGGGSSNWTVTDSVLYTNNEWGITRGNAENMLWGDFAHTHINLGVVCTTGTNGFHHPYATIGGGYGNIASERNATVGGGLDNKSYGYCSSVTGGFHNVSNDSFTTVCGGNSNLAYFKYSTICGGGGNSAEDIFSFVGGGLGNNASGTYSAICGGHQHEASGNFSSICGGADNSAW